MAEINSFHTFLFPFKWEIYQGKNHDNKPLIERSNINDFVKNIDSDYWNEFQFKPKNFNGLNTYNEFAYFYDHARDVLNLNPKYKGVNLFQYEYSGLNENSTFNLNIKGKEFTLKITEVLLNVYENGIGVISYFLENSTYNEFNDILLINDFGRRIYPQFLGNKEPFTQDTKNNFLPNCITINQVNTFLGNTLIEDFGFYNSFSNIQECSFVLPQHIQGFLGIHFKSFLETLQQGNIAISPIIDDRMYVLSLVLNDKIFNELSNFSEENYAYSQSEKWYEYIFVDGQGTNCKSKKMLKKLNDEATYDRWIENKNEGKPSGILYGISRYSLVAIASNNWFFRNIISKHFSNQYFQLVLLSLVQRSYIINFSGEVARISQKLSSKMDFFNSESKSISQLYLLYIKFVNRIYFREVTPQEQGIEMYNLIQKQMGIKDEIKDLDSEIEELNSYAESNQQNKLTLIAGRFIFPSIVISLLGLDAIKNIFKGWNCGTGLNWWQILLIVTIAFFSSDYIIKLTSSKK